MNEHRFKPNDVLTANGEAMIISDAAGKLWRIGISDGNAKPVVFEEKDGERRAEGKE